MLHISVCGTAGRGADASYLDAMTFERMVIECDRYIMEHTSDTKTVMLVSGGAAWSDHIAVRLFLTGRYGGLILHMPCAWTGKEFVDNGSTANLYHRQFSYKMGISSFVEIEQARVQGARIVVHDGFHKRNTFIAKSPILIAFTTSKTKSPTAGGTLDTWNKSSAKTKHHISVFDVRSHQQM